MVVGNSKSFVKTQFSQKEDLRFRNYEAFSFTAQFGQPQKIIFSVFWVNFFCNVFSSEFPFNPYSLYSSFCTSVNFV